MCQILKARNMFRILIVDDDPSAAHLLRVLVNHLECRHELHFASDGVEALDFLRCRGHHAQAPRPNLILLDMKMPRMNGFETLCAIKNDPELCVIPVIMLSSGTSPEEVRKCYLAHANCYVVKPTNLDDSMKLIQAIKAFWIDFAFLAACDDGIAQPTDSKEKASARPAHQPV